MATTKKTGAQEAAATQTKEGIGIHAPVQPSKELGAVIGNDALPRSKVVSKVCDYIRAKKLPNPEK